MCFFLFLSRRLYVKRLRVNIFLYIIQEERELRWHLTNIKAPVIWFSRMTTLIRRTLTVFLCSQPDGFAILDTREACRLWSSRSYWQAILFRGRSFTNFHGMGTLVILQGVVNFENSWSLYSIWWRWIISGIKTSVHGDNSIHSGVHCRLTQPCHDLNGNLVKPLLKLGMGE